MALGDKHFAVAEQYLIKNNHLIISKTTPPVIITYDSLSRTAAAFSLTGMKSNDIDALELNDGIISLTSGDVSWNAKTGHAVSSGTDDLTMLPLITGYWFAWVSFFPNTELIK